MVEGNSICQESDKLLMHAARGIVLTMIPCDTCRTIQSLCQPLAASLLQVHTMFCQFVQRLESFEINESLRFVSVSNRHDHILLQGGDHTLLWCIRPLSQRGSQQVNDVYSANSLV